MKMAIWGLTNFIYAFLSVKNAGQNKYKIN